MFLKHLSVFLVSLLLQPADPGFTFFPRKNSCDILQPCGNRGKCIYLKRSHTHDILSTICMCTSRYSGRWCQFVDGKYKPVKKENVPGTPAIITKTSIPQYDHYKLTFKRVRDPRAGKVLYYVVRYNDYGSRRGYEWRSIIVPARGRNVYTVSFTTFDWGYEYDIEVYAANKYGLGPPVKQTIRPPRVSIPRFVETSEDKSDKKAICCKRPFKLFCKAKGTPSPKYSWLINGKQLVGNSDTVKIRDGALEILKPSAKHHEGYYRCVATNAWGTAMSRPIKVEFFVPGDFLYEATSWEGIPVTHNVHLGKHFELLCPDHVPRYPWNVKWSASTKSGDVRDFPSSERVWINSRGNLYFSYVTQDDVDFVHSNGGLRCNVGPSLVKGRPFEGSNLFKLVKKGTHKPNISLGFLEKPKNVEVLEGNSAEFYCTAKSSSKTIIRWIKGKARAYLHNSQKYQILDYGRVLQIRNTRKTDSRTYTCVIYVKSKKGDKNYEGKSLATKYPAKKVFTATAKLSVSGLSDLKHRIVSTIRVYQGTSLALTCGNGGAMEKFQWYFNGKALEQRSEIKVGVINGQNISYSCHNGRLVIPSTEEYVSGVYQCDVQLKSGIVTMAQYVHVRGFDAVDPINLQHKRSSKIILKDKSSATLTCMPRPFHTFPIIWKNLPETKTSHFRMMENGFLRIYKIRKNDTMRVSCIIPSEKSVSITRNISADVTDGVNGGWSEWSLWGLCRPPYPGCEDWQSYIRTRSCKNPVPKYGGKYCVGSPTEINEECVHGIGLENGLILDRLLTCSHPSYGQKVPTPGGMMEGAHPEYARLNGMHAWCGQVNIPSNQQNYLQIHLGRVLNLTAIATQGMGVYVWYHVASYSLRFSMDDLGWFDYSTPNKVFEGNSLNRTTVKHYFDHLVYAIHVRISVVTYTFVPCMRFELYGCDTLPLDTVIQTRQYVRRPPITPQKQIALQGIWAGWSPWSDCLHTVGKICGEKFRMRVRECHPNLKKAPLESYKLFCKNASTEKETCGYTECPVWSSWSTWGSCKIPARGCGQPLRTRTRNCPVSIPKFVQQYCPGPKKQAKKCAYVPCPVHGAWSSWSTWSACSTSCNSGVKYRTRACTNPIPKHGGLKCKGENRSKKKCFIKPCKVHGGWSSWSTWSACSVSCSSGLKSRNRTCTNPVPKYGGMQCEGERRITEQCHPGPCKALKGRGGWSKWSKWSSCSASCDSGVQTRVRTCFNPNPKHRDKKCSGEKVMKTKCNIMACNGKELEVEKDNLALMMGAAGGAVLFLVVVICCCCLVRRTKSETQVYKPLPEDKSDTTEKEPLLDTDAEKSEEVSTPAGEPAHVPAFLSAKSLPAPPPPPPAPAIPTSKGFKPPPPRTTPPPSSGKRRALKKPPQPDTIYGGVLGFGKASMESDKGKIKDAQIHKISSPKKPKSGRQPPPAGPPEKFSTYDELVGFDKASLEGERGKIKDAKIHKVSSPKKPKSIPQAPPAGTLPEKSSADSTYGGMIGFDKASLESERGKVKDAKIHKISSPKKPKSIPQAPPAGTLPEKSSADSTYGGMVGFDKASLESERGKIKDAQIHKISSSNKSKSVPQDPTAPVPPPPPPASTPLPPPVHQPLGSGQPMTTIIEGTYGGLIDFEKAVLQPGEEEDHVKKAKIQKIVSKKKLKKPKE